MGLVLARSALCARLARARAFASAARHPRVSTHASTSRACETLERVPLPTRGRARARLCPSAAHASLSRMRHLHTPRPELASVRALAPARTWSRLCAPPRALRAPCARRPCGLLAACMRAPCAAGSARSPGLWRRGAPIHVGIGLLTRIRIGHGRQPEGQPSSRSALGHQCGRLQ